LGLARLLALVSTVGAILLFFAGMARVGPSVAAILSVLEPVSPRSGPPWCSARR
jgi:drug/metabolite transporter (DMT)-like permease